MAEIDKLEIKVVSNGKSAAKALGLVTDELRKLNKAIDEGGMLKVSVETERVAKATQKATKSSNGFLSSLVRVAKYRLFRTTLKLITQTFREGLGNLYEYSAALNSTDSAMNKSTMDAYASSLLYLKNSAGAAAAPLLQALLPVVQQLVDWFVAGANAVNQFISALQGKSTFTRAVYTMTEFGDSTRAATGAAKELKKTVMGFDELNLLQIDHDRGSGGGAATPDYSKMFEEAEIDENISKIAEKLKPLVEWLKENFVDIVEYAVAIGLAMKAWKIAKGVVNFFKTIGSRVTQSGIGKTISALGTGSGLTGILAGLGLTAVIAASEFALVYNAVEKGREIFENSEAYQNLQRIGQNIADTYAKTRQRLDEFGQTVEKWRDKLAKIDLAKKLTGEIFDLYDKTNKTKDEIALMEKKIDQLNGLKLEGLSITYSKATGKILETRDAVLAVIGALDQQARAAALQDLLVESYRLQYGLSGDLEKQSQSEAEAFRAYLEAVAKYDKLYDSMTGGNLSGWDAIAYGAAGGAVETLSATSPEIQAAAQEVADAKEKWEQATLAKDSTSKELEKINEQIEHLKKQDLSGFYGELGKVHGVSKQTEDELVNINKQLKTLQSGVKIDVSKIIEARDALYTARVNAYNLYTNLQNASKYKLRKMDSYALQHAYVEYDPTFSYASGGFPEAGTMFLAGEAGSPEMVGTINGRTAVANSDQIVQAVSSGVYSAVVAAMGGANRNGNDIHISLQMGEYELADAVVSALNNQTRRIGYSQLEGV